MRQIKHSGVFILIFSCFFSCKKTWLEQSPLGGIDESQLTNKKGVEALLTGAYSLLDGAGSAKNDFLAASSTTANWIYGSICGTEAYTGRTGDITAINAMEQFEATSENSLLAAKWGTLYDAIQRCNDVLRIMKKASDIDADDQKRIEGEARFLRGFYHFELKKIWKNIPFVNEDISYENNNYRLSNEKDCWPDIEADLKFAADNLPVDPYKGAIGRATTFTAKALLAKALLFQQKFSAARPFLYDIINSSRFSLGKYADNFFFSIHQNPESVFFVQMSVNDGGGGWNGNWGNQLTFLIKGPGGCCDYLKPSQFLVNHFKTDFLTGLPDLDHFNDVDVTSDEGIASGNPFTPYPGTLDPRLDWTVGRRGIPFLDWGIHPGQDWAFEPENFGHYSPKKNMFYSASQSQITDASYWASTTANTFTIIRYAEILLWAAEVEIESGELEKGRQFINLVRERAADQAGWVKNDAGTFAPFAANYKIGIYPAGSFTSKEMAIKALRFERMLELGLEGHRFFDLVRWGIAKEEIDLYLQKEKVKRTYLNIVNFKKNCNEYFPIPVRQIDLSIGADGKPQMKQNPCY
jgi:hypothetical protein